MPYQSDTTGGAGMPSPDKIPGNQGRVGSYSQPCRPQGWHLWTDRLQHEASVNRRWHERWQPYKPEASTDLPWLAAMQASADLSSPRGTGSSVNWATGGMSKEGFAATLVEVKRQSSIRLPSILTVRTAEQELLERQPTQTLRNRRVRRPDQFGSGLRTTSTTSLTFDMGWDAQLGMGTSEFVGRGADMSWTGRPSIG
jgi:hypothetical protein